jgi:hypothetical protein
VLAAACAAQNSPPRTANPNRYIYVTAETMPGQCYRDLGTLEFEESFADSTIDPDGSNMAKKLRALAFAKYPNDVDAVINLHPEDNEAGTTVRVTGEAVEIEDHTTVTCALRDAPAVLDSAAASAAGGIAGTVAGGLLSGSPTWAMGSGASGALAVGAHELAAHHANSELQRQQVLDQLADQLRQIRQLQSERASLATCQDEEVPLSSCELQQPSKTRQASANQADYSDYRDESQFELQKHVQEQQEYITQLKQQISDIKWGMDNPPQH